MNVAVVRDRARRTEGTRKRFAERKSGRTPGMVVTGGHMRDRVLVGPVNCITGLYGDRARGEAGAVNLHLMGRGAAACRRSHGSNAAAGRGIDPHPAESIGGLVSRVEVAMVPVISRGTELPRERLTGRKRTAEPATFVCRGRVPLRPLVDPAHDIARVDVYRLRVKVKPVLAYDHDVSDGLIRFGSGGPRSLFLNWIRRSGLSLR